MKSFKVASACVILAVVMTLSMACTVFAQKESGMARGERFIIKALMPIVDPEMVSIRLMLVGVDKRIDRAQMEPSLKGGITKTRIAVRSEKPGSSWLTVIGQEPLYRIYQVMTGTAQATPAFVPTLTWAGAEHVLLGTVSFGGFTFDSDPSFPLHFKLVQDVGYVYLCGRGTVSMPGGQKVTLGEAEEIGDFVVSLTAEDQLEREAAAEALGWLVKTKRETDQAFPALIKALKDNAMEVRRNAAAALGRIGDVRAQAALGEALKDEDEWVRAVVADALQKLEQPASDS